MEEHHVHIYVMTWTGEHNENGERRYRKVCKCGKVRRKTDPTGREIQ